MDAIRTNAFAGSDVTIEAMPGSAPAPLRAQVVPGSPSPELPGNSPVETPTPAPAEDPVNNPEEHPDQAPPEGIPGPPPEMPELPRTR